MGRGGRGGPLAVPGCLQVVPELCKVALTDHGQRVLVQDPAAVARLPLPRLQKRHVPVLAKVQQRLVAVGLEGATHGGG